MRFRNISFRLRPVLFPRFRIHQCEPLRCLFVFRLRNSIRAFVPVRFIPRNHTTLGQPSPPFCFRLCVVQNSLRRVFCRLCLTSLFRSGSIHSAAQFRFPLRKLGFGALNSCSIIGVFQFRQNLPALYAISFFHIHDLQPSAQLGADTHLFTNRFHSSRRRNQSIIQTLRAQIRSSGQRLAPPAQNNSRRPNQNHRGYARSNLYNPFHNCPPLSSQSLFLCASVPNPPSVSGLSHHRHSRVLRHTGS